MIKFALPQFGAKNFFFDREVVKKSADKGILKSLARAGAFVRTAAKTSLKRRKKPSPPGSPPSVHSKDAVANLKNIWFAKTGPYEVVVGPVGLNQRDELNGNSGTGIIPPLHEFGGTMGVTEFLGWDGQWHRLSKRKRIRQTTQIRKRRSRYPARPFMHPALKAARAQLIKKFGNSIIK